jgi:hypothetical protein
VLHQRQRKPADRAEIVTDHALTWFSREVPSARWPLRRMTRGPLGALSQFFRHNVFTLVPLPLEYLDSRDLFLEHSACSRLSFSLDLSHWSLDLSAAMALA